jgi:hypothetical protein
MFASLEPPPALPPVSLGTTGAFVLVVVAVGVMWVAGSAYAGRALGESAPQRRRHATWVALGFLGWMAVVAAVTASGLTSDPPTRAMPLFLAANLVAIAAALSPLGRRLAHGLPVAALVAYQGFRLPLEIVLHRMWREGALPVQMTWSGDNYDVVTGLAAIVLAAGLAWRGPSKPWVAAFSLLGLALLVRVASIAVLSGPFPWRAYSDGVPVLLVFELPWVFIVSVCVAGALAGHVVLLRWLWRKA